jgi:hypothetical protein
MDLIADLKDERLELDTLCPQCGPRPLLDEDGACAHCGSDAQGAGVDVVMQSLRAALEEIKRMQDYFGDVTAVAKERDAIRKTLEKERKDMNEMVAMVPHIECHSRKNPCAKCFLIAESQRRAALKAPPKDPAPPRVKSGRS